MQTNVKLIQTSMDKTMLSKSSQDNAYVFNESVISSKIDIVDSLVRENPSMLGHYRYSTDSSNIIYYTFAVSAGSASLNYVEVAGPQQIAALYAMKELSAITGIQFELATDLSKDVLRVLAISGENMPYGLPKTTGGYYSPRDHIVAININQMSYSRPALMVHEFGHALGMAHPFDVNPKTGAPWIVDSAAVGAQTAMSYTHPGGPFDILTGYDDIPDGYRSADIAALNWMYGGDGFGGRYGYDSTYGQTVTPGQFKVGSTFTTDDKVNGKMIVNGSYGYNQVTTDIIKTGIFNDTIHLDKTKVTGPVYVDGLYGIDTLVLTGNRADYTVAMKLTSSWLDADYSVANPVLETVSRTLNQVEAKVSGQGIDAHIYQVERIKFADKSVALDVAKGFAGDVIKLTSVVFGKSALNDGITLAGTHYTAPTLAGVCLAVLDSGESLANLMTAALTVKLGASFTNEQAASLLLTNIIGSSSLTPELVSFMAVNNLNAGEMAVIAGNFAANSSPNVVSLVGHIDLEAMALQGLIYV